MISFYTTRFTDCLFSIVTESILKKKMENLFILVPKSADEFFLKTSILDKAQQNTIFPEIKTLTKSLSDYIHTSSLYKKKFLTKLEMKIVFVNLLLKEKNNLMCKTLNEEDFCSLLFEISDDILTVVEEIEDLEAIKNDSEERNEDDFKTKIVKTFIKRWNTLALKENYITSLDKKKLLEEYMLHLRNNGKEILIIEPSHNDKLLLNFTKILIEKKILKAKIFLSCLDKNIKNNEWKLLKSFPEHPQYSNNRILSALNLDRKDFVLIGNEKDIKKDLFLKKSFSLTREKINKISKCDFLKILKFEQFNDELRKTISIIKKTKEKKIVVVAPNGKKARIVYFFIKKLGIPVKNFFKDTMLESSLIDLIIFTLNILSGKKNFDGQTFLKFLNQKIIIKVLEKKGFLKKIKVIEKIILKDERMLLWKKKIKFSPTNNMASLSNNELQIDEKVYNWIKEIKDNFKKINNDISLIALIKKINTLVKMLIGNEKFLEESVFKNYINILDIIKQITFSNEEKPIKYWTIFLERMFIKKKIKTTGEDENVFRVVIVSIEEAFLQKSDLLIVLCCSNEQIFSLKKKGNYLLRNNLFNRLRLYNENYYISNFHKKFLNICGKNKQVYLMFSRKIIVNCKIKFSSPAFPLVRLEENLSTSSVQKILYVKILKVKNQEESFFFKIPNSLIPKTFSISDVNLLISKNDEIGYYSLFISKILGLNKLRRNELYPNKKDIGIIIHRIIKIFTEKKEFSQNILPEILNAELSSFSDISGLKLLYYEKFKKILLFLLEFLAKQRIIKSFSEIKGSIFIAEKNRKIKILGIADRIEQHENNKYVIYDYKNHEKIEPIQLNLLTIILLCGGFSLIHKKNVFDIKNIYLTFGSSKNIFLQSFRKIEVSCDKNKLRKLYTKVKDVTFKFITCSNFPIPSTDNFLSSYHKEFFRKG